jgi:glucose/arabinose dehydrogenase
MTIRLAVRMLASVVVFAGCGCVDTSAKRAPAESPDPTVGANPTLPEPEEKKLIPTVRVAEAIGWPSGRVPMGANGLAVSAFASGLDHPRWLYVLPNGDVLVAETNAPKRPKDEEGVKAKVMKQMRAKAGAGTPSANRITLLRDGDGDGIAETRSVLVENLYSPFGMALVGAELYVANADGIVKFPYRAGDTRIAAAPTPVTDLPGGERNHHWTKNIIADREGARLYATVGSNSNVAEHGMAEEEGRAAIWEIDLKTGTKKLFATGLRNPNGMAWEPTTGTLWTVANERDELGNDLVPDYLTSVKQGVFYGWPYSYFGKHVDKRAQPPRPDLVAKAIAPDYALGTHVAPLGLVFYQGSLLPQRYAGGAFIGEHGSWNRKPRSGYKVVFVAFSGGRPAGSPEDVLTGFVDAEGNALGRPVGVAVDKAGALLVADDVGNVIWRVTPAAPKS